MRGKVVVMISAVCLFLAVAVKLSAMGSLKEFSERSIFARYERGELVNMERAMFAAGCFWGVEAAFRNVPGVVATAVGYAGGWTVNPSYQDVCTGKTGHAEVVNIIYDPKVVNYEQLLDVFWRIHDPTSMDRQGPDVGTQYRSVIFFYDSQQQQRALSSLERLEKSGRFSGKVVTAVVPAKEFYRGEEYHQQYYAKRGIKTPVCVLPP